MSIPLVPPLPGLHWPGLFAHHRDLSMDQIELNCVLTSNCIVWNRTAFVCLTELFEIELFICIKIGLALTYNGWYALKPKQTNKQTNNPQHSQNSKPLMFQLFLGCTKNIMNSNHLQWLICHKTQPNKTKPTNYNAIYFFRFDASIGIQG